MFVFSLFFSFEVQRERYGKFLKVSTHHRTIRRVPLDRNHGIQAEKLRLTFSNRSLLCYNTGIPRFLLPDILVRTFFDANPLYLQSRCFPGISLSTVVWRGDRIIQSETCYCYILTLLILRDKAERKYNNIQIMISPVHKKVITTCFYNITITVLGRLTKK